MRRVLVILVAAWSALWAPWWVPAAGATDTRGTTGVTAVTVPADTAAGQEPVPDMDPFEALRSRWGDLLAGFALAQADGSATSAQALLAQRADVLAGFLGSDGGAPAAAEWLAGGRTLFDRGVTAVLAARLGDLPTPTVRVPGPVGTPRLDPQVTVWASQTRKAMSRLLAEADRDILSGPAADLDRPETRELWSRTLRDASAEALRDAGAGLLDPCLAAQTVSTATGRVDDGLAAVAEGPVSRCRPCATAGAWLHNRTLRVGPSVMRDLVGSVAERDDMLSRLPEWARAQLGGNGAPAAVGRLLEAAGTAGGNLDSVCTAAREATATTLGGYIGQVIGRVLGRDGG